MQLTFEGKTIDQLAIDLIRAYEPPEGYYLGFSGGKDSVVILHLAKRAKVKFMPVYNVSPVDPPHLQQFIKLCYPEVIWEKHAQGFFSKHVMRHGLPRRKGRWCCELIKEAGGAGRVKILGMRASESLKRRGYKCFDTYRGATWLLPILNWSDSDVWQYIAEHNIKTTMLYRYGFKRIGCVLCPYAGKDEVKLSMQLFPKTVAAWRAAARNYFKKRVERGTPMPFETDEDYWQWWIAR